MSSDEKSILKKTGIAAGIMMASVLGSRIIGIAREMSIAYAGGTGGGVDAYQVAFVLPEILNHVVASGFLSITFIPIFSSYLAKGEEEKGWEILSIILTIFGLCLLILTLLAMIFAPRLVSCLAPGLDNPDLLAKAVRMTRIILPAQLFFFAGGLFNAVQYSKEHFLVPALAPLIYNTGIIMGGLTLGPYMGMEGFAWGVLGGSFIGNFLVQFMGARSLGMRISPRFNLKHPDLKRYILLTLPLMVGLTMTFSTEILLKYFGSQLARGSIAALNYGLRIMFILVGLFGQAAGVASYPFMAGMAAQGKMKELNNLLNTTLKYLLLIIPVSALFVLLRYEIVVILFKRGVFDANAVLLTAGLLPFLLAGSFAFAAQTVVVRGFYATQNTWLPALFGTISVLACLPLFPILTHILEARGVALALSLAAVFQTVLLFELWIRKIKNPQGRSIYFFFIKMTCLSIGILTLLCPVHQLIQENLDTSGFSGALVSSIITGALFLFFLLTAGHIFHIQEIRELTRRVLKKFSPGS